MEENKEFLVENEFLNILDEPESTSQEDIILGDGVKADCKRDEGCKSEGCDSDGGGCGTKGETPGDEPPPGAGYPYFLFFGLTKRAYYKNGTFPNHGDYPIRPVHFWYRGHSAANQTYKDMITQGFSSNTAYTSTSFTGELQTKVYCSGMASTNLTNSYNTNVFIGYVYLAASATNNRYQTTETHPVSVYMRFYPPQSASTFNSVYFNQLLPYYLSFPVTLYPIKEKTFKIKVQYGVQAVQGCVVTINNLTTLFPQYSSESVSGNSIKTGLIGYVVLCTSATTSNTITGTVQREGFNNNAPVSFTATQGTLCTINLSHTNNSEKVLFDTYKASVINNFAKNMYLTYYYTTPIQGTNPSITNNLLHSFSLSAVTYDSINDNMCIRAYDLLRIKPGLESLVDDETLGKFSNETYTLSNNITITTGYTYVVDFVWDMGNGYDFNFPGIQAGALTGDVWVDFYTTTVTQSQTYNQVLVASVKCVQGINSISKFLDFEDFSGLSVGGDWPTGQMRVTFYVKKRTNTGTLYLVTGTYNYTPIQISGGNLPGE